MSDDFSGQSPDQSLDQPPGQSGSNPWSPAGWLADARLAIGFFTLLPVPTVSGRLADSARAFPLAGLIIGALGALCYLVAIEIGLSGLLAAILALAAIVLMTGALHEDGLADFGDMLGTRGGPKARLAAMRNSRIGGFGVLALGFVTAIKVAAIIDLGEPGIVAAALVSAHICSRGVLPLIMRSLPLARADGLAHQAGRPSAGGARLSLGLSLVLAALVAGPGAAVVAIIAALIAAFLVAEIARRRIGGYTGDVLGAAQQLAELAILVNLVALS